MPNHVTTICTITGPAEDIARFKAAAIVARIEKGETFQILDFNAAIPMPAVLDGIEESTRRERAVALLVLAGSSGPPFANGGLYDWEIKQVRESVGAAADANIADVARAYLDAHPDEKALGERSLEAILKTGFASWYPWCTENWGTKWNSYSFSIECEDPLKLKFDTAWAFPGPVFDAFARAYPELNFDCLCFDEGWGFAGKGAFNPQPDQGAFALTEATADL